MLQQRHSHYDFISLCFLQVIVYWSLSEPGRYSERGAGYWHSYKVFIAPLKGEAIWTYSLREMYVCVSVYNVVWVCACVCGTFCLSELHTNGFVGGTKLFKVACQALTFCKGDIIPLQKTLCIGLCVCVCVFVCKWKSLCTSRPCDTSGCFCATSPLCMWGYILTWSWLNM